MSVIPGQLLGAYRLGPPIGRGGMGVVYAARDTRLEREVVVKVIGGATTEDARRRALREARAAARLRHPGLVPVLDLVEADGQLCIVMERVDGGSLADLLRAGPVPWPRAVRLAAEACAALAAAHDQGVVHRDVKPGNLLLDAEGRVRVVDFGLALLTDTSTLSMENGAGTPAYMSPEQCRADEVTPRSDLYSLGVTLYHLLVGRPPFEGDTAVQVMFAHCSRAVPDPRRLRPELPEGCAAVVLRATARLPHHRYADAREMEAALRRLLEGAATDRPTSPSQPLGAQDATFDGSIRGSAAFGAVGAALRSPAWRWGLLALGAAAAVSPDDTGTSVPTAIGPAAEATAVAHAPPLPGFPGAHVVLPLPGEANALAATPDGRLLAVGGMSGTTPWLRLWEVVGGALRPVPAPAPDRPLVALALARHARLVAIGGPGGVAVASWLRADGWTALDTQPACGVALGADGAAAWAVAPDGAVRGWLPDGGWSRLAEGGTCAVATAGLASGVAGLADGLRWGTGAVAPVGPVRAVGPAAGGTFVAVAGDAGVRALAARGGERLLSEDGSYAHVAWSVDLADVAAAGERLTLWRMPSATRTAEVPLDSAPLGLAWLEGGLALLLEDGLHLWGVDGG
jgi:hypothetical protein